MQNFVRSGVAAGRMVISGAACAANLPAPTTPAVIPPYNWTGFYIGAEAGDAIGHGEFIDNLAGGGLGSGQWDRFIGGRQIDYDYQADIIVMAGEAMSGAFSGEFRHMAREHWGDVFRSTSEANWMATGAGRIGIYSVISPFGLGDKGQYPSKNRKNSRAPSRDAMLT
jgi:hypothetical protein